MLREQVDAPGELRVARRDRPALPGGDRLHRVEAEGGHVGDRSDGFSAMDGAYGVRGILDEQEVEFVAYLAYLIGVHVHASEVDRNDGLRFLVDSLTD